MEVLLYISGADGKQWVYQGGLFSGTDGYRRTREFQCHMSEDSGSKTPGIRIMVTATIGSSISGSYKLVLDKDDTSSIELCILRLNMDAEI